MNNGNNNTSNNKGTALAPINDTKFAFEVTSNPAFWAVIYSEDRSFTKAIGMNDRVWYDDHIRPICAYHGYLSILMDNPYYNSLHRVFDESIAESD